ncbi:DUF2290 domain-containing protein [Mycetohabitans endofungorum]|uniref:DUF2290 domain-containing protein n=1 Tax=Mycetohabitans endofungorum TaxID=417203 RepID=UPI002B061DBE|nr:DUF2290 domain-containing protein [Mycetohabitans endofungorum]
MKPPQQPRTVRDDIEQIVSSLIELGIADDQNFPVLRQLSAQGWEITFGGAEHVSIAMGEIDYEVIHLELSDKRSYNVKLLDGGLLQMMYLFEGEQLVKHRLAYYPSPSLRAFQDDPDLYMRDELFLDIVSRRIVPFPLRFDFDQAAAVDINHPCCHLTLDDVQGCRIPVSSGITPRWFAEFILRNFYQTEPHDFVGRLPAHKLGFDEAITENEKLLMHVVVPTI